MTAIPCSYMIPTTILPRLVRPRVGLHVRTASAVPAHLPPVAADATARWQPQRWLLGLPALVDEHDLDGWLRWARPGVEVSYHCGLSLAAARESDDQLDQLARALLLRSGSSWAITTPPPCGHVRSVITGSGDLELAQRRIGGSAWLYLARRRG